MAWEELHTFAAGDVLRSEYFEAMRRDYQELKTVNYAINRSSFVSPTEYIVAASAPSNVTTAIGLTQLEIVTNGRPLLLLANPVFKANVSTATGYLYFAVDGVAGVAHMAQFYAGNITVPMFEMRIVAPGLHTIDIYAHIQAAQGNVSIWPNHNLFLLAWELGHG